MDISGTWSLPRELETRAGFIGLTKDPCGLAYNDGNWRSQATEGASGFSVARQNEYCGSIEGIPVLDIGPGPLPFMQGVSPVFEGSETSQTLGSSIFELQQYMQLTIIINVTACAGTSNLSTERRDKYVLPCASCFCTYLPLHPTLGKSTSTTTSA